MLGYGYKKGCIGVVASLASVIIAFVLAYFLSETVGNYIQETSWGMSISKEIKSSVVDLLKTSEESGIVEFIQEKLKLSNKNTIASKIVDYVFTGVGFIIVFIGARIIVFIVQKVLETIFELPVLKSFNKLGGIIAAAILFVVEFSIILAVIESLSSLSIMGKVVNIINTSVITKELYDHNIFTNIILSKII